MKRLTAILCTLLACAVSRAQKPDRRLEPRLKVSVQPVVLRAKPDAPRDLIFVFDWNGGEILEGHLECLVRTPYGTDIAEVESPDLALATGEQSFLFRLPPFVSQQRAGAELELDMTFVTDSRRMSLDTYSLSTNTGGLRTVVTGVCEPDALASSRTMELARSLRLGQMQPSEDRSRFGETLSESIVRVPPERLPAHALSLSCYDLLIVSAEAFADLRQRQLDALQTWVRAGGSLLLFTNAVLREPHAVFLHRLAQTEAPPFVLGPDGRPVPTDALPADGVGLCCAGLGRSIIDAKGIFLDTPSTQTVRTAAAFLWKLRTSQAQVVIENGAWAKDQQSIDQNNPGRYAYMQMMGRHGQATDAPLALYPTQIQSASQLGANLFPRDIKVMPPWVMLAILIVFVLIVGPVDYCVLGLLRRRWLTWIAFPTTCVIFTWFTVFMARQYMGDRDYGQAVRVTDVTPAGEVLRESEMRFLLAGRRRTHEEELHDSLISPLSRTQLMMYGMPRMMQTATPGTDVLRYIGHVPFRYRVQWRMEQWSPRIFRTLEISQDRGEGPAHVHWDRISFARLKADRYGIDLPTVLFGGSPPADVKAVMLLSGHRCEVFDRRFGDQWLRRGPQNPTELFLQEATKRPEVGFFSVVSQVSPSCSEFMEDLAILDSSDRGQFVLAVMRSDGRNWTLERCLYHDESSSLVALASPVVPE